VTETLSTASAFHRRFVLLTTLRWVPVGLLIPVTVLYALDRGLDIAQVGVVASIQGFVVLALELPSGGLADAWGRRPVLVTASAVSLAAVVTLSLAQSLPMFIAVYALQGIFRALDSGVLESWFADGVLRLGSPESVPRGLSAAGVALGVGIGGGAILASGLTLIAPALGADPLALPIYVSAALTAGYLVAVLALVHDDPGMPRTSLRSATLEVPRMLRDGARLLAHSRVLLALVAVELFWGFGMIAFENLTPVRLGELLGDSQQAAAVFGPVTATAWLLFAGGSALVNRVTSPTVVPIVAALFRILQGATVVALGLVAGPVGVIVAFLACYTVHGASNPLHNTLLHAQVTGNNRATVLSMNSMVSQPAGAVGAIVLSAIAGSTSTSTAMVVGGIVLAAAAPFYLPAWVAARRARA